MRTRATWFPPALGFILLVVSASGLFAAEPPRPNILIILADQWRAQAFGFAGDPNVKTPHLDRLAGESVNFRHAVSGLPVCTPMRASLLTGQRPLTHGLFLNDVQLNTNAVTLAKLFKQAGYDTGYIGKWHMDGRGRSNFIPPERRQGFEYWKVLECTHNYTNSFYYADAPEKLKWPGYDAQAQTRDACDWLRTRTNAAKPFCLVLAWGPPHDPYQTAPANYRALYAAKDIKLRPNVPAGMEAAARQMLAGYYAHCTALDDCVAELRRTLKESGLAEDTLLVFSADHGDLLGSHGFRNKQQPYDESIRVPMLWHWPKGLTQSRALDAPMNTEDILPTLLGLSGLPKPASIEGLDYSGHLRGGKNPGDDATVILCVAPFGQWERRIGGREYRGLRTTRHTYVRDLTGPWLLFDNEADPYQTNNLANVAAHATLQRELDALLLKKLKANGDEFLPADATIKKWGYTVDKNGTVAYTP